MQGEDRRSHLPVPRAGPDPQGLERGSEVSGVRGRGRHHTSAGMTACSFCKPSTCLEAQDSPRGLDVPHTQAFKFKNIFTSHLVETSDQVQGQEQASMGLTSLAVDG